VQKASKTIFKKLDVRVFAKTASPKRKYVGRCGATAVAILYVVVATPPVVIGRIQTPVLRQK
jgi:hypothetical protein